MLALAQTSASVGAACALLSPAFELAPPACALLSPACALLSPFALDAPAPVEALPVEAPPACVLLSPFALLAPAPVELPPLWLVSAFVSPFILVVALTTKVQLLCPSLTVMVAGGVRAEQAVSSPSTPIVCACESDEGELECSDATLTPSVDRWPVVAATATALPPPPTNTAPSTASATLLCVTARTLESICLWSLRTDSMTTFSLANGGQAHEDFISTVARRCVVLRLMVLALPTILAPRQDRLLRG